MSKRNDIHRPGAIIPANYEFVFSYNGSTSQGGWPIPSYGINCELDRRVCDKEGHIIKNGEHDADGHCCIIGLLHVAKVKFVETGATCQCSICSTHFVYGDVWKHIPTGEYLNVGHNCADKYNMLADRSAHELALGRLQAAAAVQVQKKLNQEEREAFLAKHPGLGEALECNHPIVSDIKAKFVQYRSLSDKQVALVLKLDNEVKNPKPVEARVEAPQGRTTFRGTVVSVKNVEGNFGVQTKLTVKVTTPEGVWLAWGTCPAALVESLSFAQLRGTEVEITATLKPGREKGFALMSRPLGKVLTPPPAPLAN